MVLMAFAIACVDESLDPIKFNSVKKATFLALRGSSADALTDTGCSNSFFKDAIIGDEEFTVVSDFLAEDQESLQEVQMFAEIVNTTSKGLEKRARKQVGTFAGSVFTFPTDSKVKRGTVSVTLAKILGPDGLNIKTDSLVKLQNADITMSIDLVLTDGSKVLAANMTNDNLYQSVIFQPAQKLVYCANAKKDFLPTATTSLLGIWGLTKDKKKVSRTEIPSLKGGVKDTLYIKFDNDIITAPTVTFDPPTAGTNTTLVKAKKVDSNGFYTKDDSKNAFYLIYTAGGTYTGEVAAIITNATAEVNGAILTMAKQTQIINVDNTKPVLLSQTAGTRIGKGQFVTMKVSFNEPLSGDEPILVSFDGTATGLESLDEEEMKLSSDGLSATFVYSFKLADPLVPATHGDLTVTFTDAFDLAGNSIPLGSKTLTVDVNAPPAPTLTATGTYDFGTQIYWQAQQTVGGGNPGGSDTGSVYFIAVPTGDPAPTKFSVDLDGVATWLGSEDDPDSKSTPKAKLPIDGEQQGIVEVEDGDSGTVFTSFGANGDLDVYAVFVSSSGTISAIAPKAGLVTAPGTGNPLKISMN